MIHEIEIENFRGIDNLKISATKRVNVIVGRNGTGKTALLEAIFLASGSSPELLQRTKIWRGREGPTQANLEIVQDFLWAETFRDPSKRRAAIKLKGDNEETRSIEITVNEGAGETIISNDQIRNTVGARFLYRSPEYGEQNVGVRIDGNGIAIESVPSSMFAHFIASRLNVGEAETARLYSRLRVEGRAASFERAMLSEFQILESIEVEAPTGPPAIYGKLKSGRILPLTMISSGINHLAAILLRLYSKERTILLIDEIENGFFHDRYSSIWKRLYEAAVEVNGQIFATTHSLECLRALREAIKENEKDVRFLRSRHDERSEVAVEELSGKSLFQALQIGEVR